MAPFTSAVPASVIVIVAVPAATAVIRPLSLTVATLVLLDWYVTAPTAPVVVICDVSPSFVVTLALDVRVNDDAVRGSDTVIEITALPDFIVSVPACDMIMLVVPSATAVTVPSEATVATFLLLDVNVIAPVDDVVKSVPFVITYVSPMFRLLLVVTALRSLAARRSSSASPGV